MYGRNSLRPASVAVKNLEMTDTESEPRRGKVPTREFLADFRSHLTDRELREKYGLSARSFVSLIKALVQSNVISRQDLSIRRQMSEKRDIAKESQFLSQLFICPNCSHPSPHPFEICPACGASTAEVGAPTRSADLVTPSGEHFYVEEAPQATTQEVELLSEEDVIEEEQEDKKDAAPEDGEPAEKKQGLGSWRSLFSKLKKT
jgi:hypothetical protein